MPPLTTELISVLGGILIGLLGGFAAAYARLRKVKPEVKSLDAQADKLQAEERKSQAEAWVMLIQSYEARLNKLNVKLDELECTIEKREVESQERDRRIDDLQGQLAQRDFIIVQQKERLTVLETEVHELRDELDEWKSGRKKKATGPLSLQGDAGS